jgi:hypothetical protein
MQREKNLRVLLQGLRIDSKLRGQGVGKRFMKLGDEYLLEKLQNKVCIF